MSKTWDSIRDIRKIINSKIYIMSDNHHGHSQIVRGTSSWEDKSGCRDFDTVEEHDKTILDNINGIVMPDDTLYILGDFCVGSSTSYLKMKKIEAYRYYRNLINCEHIHYIRGNHSPSLKEFNELEKPIFESVHEYLELRYKKNLIILFHYPILSFNSMSHGSYMLSGHQHSNRVHGRSMDIGVDSNNFKPYLIDDIIEKLRNNPIMKEGHHV